VGWAAYMAAFFIFPRFIGGAVNRAIVYIDGLNFYYGALRGTEHKWLNLETCFRRLRPGDAIQRIYYFTAIVNGDAQKRQQPYLRALATLSLVNVILGKFKTKQIRCRVQSCTYSGRRTFEAPEEKRTDVNIALQLLDDALHDRADTFVLVTGDSDLVPAIELLSRHAQIT
jgi:hypothetical protein